MEIKHTPKLHLICRTCSLEKNLNELESIFKENMNTIIMEIAAVKILKNDGLPFNICLECIVQMNSVYSFKRLCEKLENHLRDLYTINKPSNLSDNDRDDFDYLDSHISGEDFNKKVLSK